MLIDEEHDPRRDGLTTFRQSAIDNMANVVTCIMARSIRSNGSLKFELNGEDLRSRRY